jgi:putative membrane-bound dehydrogenase-like protein
MRTFRLSDPNLRVELFAAEPDVVDPVEVVFDEDGRAFAAEMRDYPEDPPPGQPPRSRIRLLEDTNGDGKVDRSVVFADNLLQVTSMLPWKGGLIVTAAPDILYLKDIDGDGKADIRQVLFTGFPLVNPESRITNLRFGIDNWIYAANNGQRGEITFPGRDILQTGSDQPTSVSVLGADFRFRLDRGLFEAESGPTQFGLAMDDWGHRFITENTVHVRHVVLPRRYLLRNPLLPAGTAAEDISDHGRPSARMFQLTPPQYWREVRTAMRQQRYRENNLNRTEMAAGYFTAAAGGTIYSGDKLSEEYYGNLFTGDVSGNLVHRDVLSPSGASFIASRDVREQDKEFLASTDPWFRPCSFATGPDGNLYMVDMYREFIETPESIPEELKKDMDFYSGTNMGRIYRIVLDKSPISPTAGTESASPQRKAGATVYVRLQLSRAATSDLVPLLAHPNGWWRLTAQRLLLERQDKSVVPALRRMVLDGDSPQARLHALYALEGLSSLDESLLEKVLADSHPALREHALQLAEMYGSAAFYPVQKASGQAAADARLASRLTALAADPSSRVRFQLALSLGAFPEAASWKALATLAGQHAQDPWFRTAILASVGQPPTLSGREQAAQLNRFARFLWEQEFFDTFEDGKGKLLEQLAAAVGVRHEEEGVTQFLTLLPGLRGSAQSQGASIRQAEPWQVVALSGLARGLTLAGAQRLKMPAAEHQLTRLLSSRSEEVQSAARAAARHFAMRGLISMAIRQALDTGLPRMRRKQAIQSLASAAFSDVQPVFEQLFSSTPDQELLQAVVSSLDSMDDHGVADLLISNWKTLGPALRDHAVDVLLNHRQRLPAFLQAIERGQIDRQVLNLPRRQKLLQNPDPQIADRSRRIFAEQPTDRARIMAAYRSALDLTGDAARGRPIFEKNCGQCHLPQNGRRIGPDLSGVSSQTKERLLQSILDPSREIQPRFTQYIVTTRDGRILDGLIVSESPGTITLRSSNAEDVTILRRNVVDIRTSSVSLMPEGLEQAMNRQDLADVIAFLQGRNLHDHHER